MKQAMFHCGTGSLFALLKKQMGPRAHKIKAGCQMNQFLANQELLETEGRERILGFLGAILSEKSLRLVMVVLAALSLIGCGTYQSGSNKRTNDLSSLTNEDGWWNNMPNSPDQQAFQANFMTLSITQMSFQISAMNSQISLAGLCFNPGFANVGIYFKVYDGSGRWIFPQDGEPYATNKVFYSGSDRLQPSTISCSSQGFWSLSIDMSTWLLNQLESGKVEVSMVAFYEGRDLYNDSTAVARRFIHLPD
jgi:hypothetical protein